MSQKSTSNIFILLILCFPLWGNSQTISATRFSDGTVATYDCDGVDDQVQINEALLYVKEQGGEVELSAHTFVIGAPIIFAGNNTTLQGQGMDETTIQLKDEAGWSYYAQNEAGEWVLHPSDPLIFNEKEAVQQLTIRDLKIDGNKYHQSIYNPMTGETIQDTPESHVFDGQGHYVAVQFEQRPGSTETVRDILFSHVFIYENSDDGFDVKNATGIRVEYCKGIRSGHSNVYFSDPIDLVIENCDFMVTSNSGIRWYDGNHILIRNNHIYGEPEKTGNSNFCIQMTSGQSSTITDDLIIEGNQLEFSAGAGIALDAKSAASAKDVIIRNNTILQCGNSGTIENIREAGGINLKNFTNTHIENNTIANCIGGGIRLGGNVGFNTEWSYETGLTAIIKNNIITHTTNGGNATASGYGIDIANGNSAICTYNNVWGNEAGGYLGCEPDVGSISIDPLYKNLIVGTIFNNTNDINADLHLQSEMGRWNTISSAWEIDASSSQCINGGDPGADFTNEPANNGNRLNLGAYGNTPFASKGIKAPPVANAGPDQYIRDEDNDGIVYVTLDGSLSTDDDAIASYSWVRNGAEIANVPVKETPFVLGTVDVTLTIFDNDGISSSDKVLIKILPYGDNLAPIADAGDDLLVTDRDNDGVETIRLDGSASHDVDAILVDYIWSENGMELSRSVSFEPTLSVGIHTLLLTVVDNEGGSASDEIEVNVRPKANYALDFNNDFNDEVVNIPNLSFFSTFTIEMWVKQLQVEEDAALIWLGGDGKRLMLKTPSSFPSWDATASNTAEDNISLNTWHHLAYVVEEGILTSIYIDGQASTINEPAAIELPSDFAIASFYGTTDAYSANFVGRMDELRYWSTARTAAQINEWMNRELTGSELGLEAYWNFNDGSGNRLSDMVGIADGTLWNMEETDWVLDTPFGEAVSTTSTNKQSVPMEIFPNPFTSSTTIVFDMPAAGSAQLSIYNTTGQKVIALRKTHLNAGKNTFEVDASKMEAGMYFCYLKSGKSMTVKKMILNSALMH